MRLGLKTCWIGNQQLLREDKKMNLPDCKGGSLRRRVTKAGMPNLKGGSFTKISLFERRCHGQSIR